MKQARKHSALSLALLRCSLLLCLGPVFLHIPTTPKRPGPVYADRISRLWICTRYSHQFVLVCSVPMGCFAVGDESDTFSNPLLLFCFLVNERSLYMRTALSVTLAVAKAGCSLKTTIPMTCFNKLRPLSINNRFHCLETAINAVKKRFR